MLTLQEIHQEAKRLLPDILVMTKSLADALLNQAIAAGPKGGCLETFSPIYLYNHCRAGCPYCGFASNQSGKRKVLTVEEMNSEARVVRDMGCEAVYLLGGSLVNYQDLKESQLSRQAEIARQGLKAVSSIGLFPVLEMSPFSRHEFKVLNQEIYSIRSGGGRFVLFQETYNEAFYRKLHGSKTRQFKGEPEERLEQVELALQAGWPEIGIGALFGLSTDVWFDVAHILAHAFALRKMGARKVTISVPRLKPIAGQNFPAKCSDENFIKLVAVFSLLGRAADNKIKVVITGRETKELRDRLSPCTDIWGVRGSTVPGGYSQKLSTALSQFDLSDRRTLAEIRADNAVKIL